MPPHVHYKKHYSRGGVQEQALLSIWSISRSKWLNSSDKRRVWDKSLTLNIKSEQKQLSDTQNSVLFAFLSNLSILKNYNKEFLKSQSFCPRLFFVYFTLKVLR